MSPGKLARNRRVRTQSTTHAKGKVERPFHFVETSLLNGREFRSLEHLNEVTAKWLAEVADVRVHRETKRRPIDLHAEELPYLIPLPDKPYDTAEVVYRTVNAEGMVSYRQNFYSVPWRHLGQVLPLRIGAFSLRSVERILAAQAQPKTPLESLGDQQQQHLREIIEDRPVPPRPTGDYEQLYLYPQEPPQDDEPPDSRE